MKTKPHTLNSTTSFLQSGLHQILLSIFIMVVSSLSIQAAHNFSQNEDITKSYKIALLEKRRASDVILKVETSLELIKQQLKNLNQKELRILKAINQRTRDLINASTRSERKAARKSLLRTEKELLQIVDTVRNSRQKMFDINGKLESANNQLDSALKKIDAIETYIQSF